MPAWSTPCHLREALREEARRSRIAGDGAEVVASSPEEFAALIRAETVKWTKVATATGIQPE